MYPPREKDTMAHYGRPVNTSLNLVSASPDSGTTVIHAEGCGHSKGSRTIRQASPHEYDAEGIYNDDYYDVAPCAATGKGFVCTNKRGHDHCA